MKVREDIKNQVRKRKSAGQKFGPQTWQRNLLKAVRQQLSINFQESKKKNICGLQLIHLQASTQDVKTEMIFVTIT